MPDRYNTHENCQHSPPVFVLSRSSNNELLGVYTSLEKIIDHYPGIREFPMNYLVKEVIIDQSGGCVCQHWIPDVVGTVVWKPEEAALPSHPHHHP